MNDIAVDHWQMGRPIRYTPGEVRGFEERARYMLNAAPEALAAIQPGEKTGFRRQIKRVPLGVIVVVAPWNYPYLTAVNAVIPALIAGNAVILKHSHQTPLCAERFLEAFVSAGVPAGVFQYRICPTPIPHGSWVIPGWPASALRARCRADERWWRPLRRVLRRRVSSWAARTLPMFERMPISRMRLKL